MSEKHRILVADDDVTMQEMFAAALEGNYQIVSVASGMDALRMAGRERPDAILLDVEMPPGIDGYETCRRLKEDEATAQIPVIFVSGHDGIEDRLKGYEAGGEDYIVKPFDEQELEAKLVHLLKVVAERDSLKQMANYASSTAMTAMTGMSEMGALLEAMRNFSACTDYRGLADAILAGLALYGLNGTAQIRSVDGVLTRTDHGDATPLEASVIGHMAKMERIVHFKSRLAITYRRVSLLVHNMPTDDADRCGRLRDHLAMLAECAETRAEAIAAAVESQRRSAAIERVSARVVGTLEDIDQAQRENQVATRLAVDVVTRRMEDAYASIALSTSQEDFMSDMLQRSIDDLLNTQTSVVSVQQQLSSIVQELKGMSECPTAE